MKKFDARMLFPVEYWWCFKKHREFNGFLFYVDILLWVFTIMFIVALFVL